MSTSKVLSLRLHQVRVLKALTTAAHPLSIAEIACATGISSSMVSRALQGQAIGQCKELTGYSGLIEKKLVSRESREHPTTSTELVAYQITYKGNKSLEKSEHADKLPSVHVGPRSRKVTVE